MRSRLSTLRQVAARRIWPGIVPPQHAEAPAVDEATPGPEVPYHEGQPYFRLWEPDIKAAYRLLLYRDPTPDELDHHLKLARTNLEYDLYQFGDLMLASPDRAAAIAGLTQPVQGKLDGITFHYRPLDTALGVVAAFYGAYEPDVAQAIERLLPQGGTFVDVGANIGLHAIRAARAVGAAGHVRCFEPNPNNVELLHLTMATNGFDHVTIRPVAVSDRPGELPLFARRGQSNATVEDGHSQWDSDLKVVVPCVRLDDELADLERLDLLKIDIEGAEPLAFAGMAQTLRKFKPRILMEVFPDALRRGPAQAEPADFLRTVEELGYQLKPIVPGQGAPNKVYPIDSIVAMPAEYHVTHVDVLAEPVA